MIPFNKRKELFYLWFKHTRTRAGYSLRETPVSVQAHLAPLQVITTPSQN